ncbi:CHRD domain-containing protein [Fodinibius roseus]|uniref:CHRD domain-containing protein n=2 Tax=Fodinibius roseus TaxID=1194090 RepID=A0A1M5BX26_9BACT|nr:CHRD domain-containing protein [Fodinibius roseus]
MLIHRGVNMKHHQSIKAYVMGILIFTLSIGLITGCGDRDSDPDMENTEMNETPQSQPDRAYNEDYDTNRGQEQSFEVSLEGSNEVPEVTTDASGSATVTLKGDSIHVEGEFSDLGSEYTASHIHKGAEGENGDPIITLEPEVGNDKTSGSWDASYLLEDDHRSALMADSLYINVHSTENKPGEIRGQITSSGMDM